ncbi:ATP-binding protein [Bradyrhizobium sp. STM 3562]|uniref:ATP-binding protein n=1 Tax=Bradyrhizobium sp. STM 3562 TaxID=578924 RepID=UPI003890FCC9
MTEPATRLRKDVFVFEPFRLYVAERALMKNDEPLAVGGRALDLLIALLERAGEVVSQKDLLARAWPNLIVDEANLRVNIAGLRKLFDPVGTGQRYIATVSGRGYCFVAPVQRWTDDVFPEAGAAPVRMKNSCLPAPLTRMVGRDETVLKLSAELMKHRFLSIVGPGGVGKTTVAIAVAHAALERIGETTCFVDMSSLADPASLPSTIGSSFGCAIQPRDPTSSLITFLRGRAALLVIDNCETAIDAAGDLAERLHRHVERAHIITTSREALRADGERVHILNSLHSPPDRPDLTTNDILCYPAAQLFVERASAAGLKTPLTDPDAPTVGRICRRLDGIPLALELAASRAGSLGLRATADLLENGFALAWKGRRTAVARHQTITTMLDWSYRILSELEKQVLCRVSVFVGDFSVGLAAALVLDANASRQAITEALAGLASKSLLAAEDDDGETRYHLLEITRSYAAAKLEQRGDAHSTHRKHAMIFCELLWRRVGLRSVFDSESSDLLGFGGHVGNIRAALGWALSDRGDPALGPQLAAMAAPLLIRYSLFDECRRSCQRALAVLPHQEEGQRLEMVLQAALSYTSMFTKGNSGEVQAALQRGLAIAVNLGDSAHQLQFLAGLNAFLYRTGDFRGSLAVARQARATAKSSKIAAGVVAAEWMLGVAYHCVGNQYAAEHHCQKGMAHSIELAVHDPILFGYDHRVRALVGLAGTLWLRGYASRALRTAAQAIREAETKSEPISLCMSLYTAQVFLRAGDVQRARDLSDRLVDCATQHGLDPFRSIGMAFRGEVAVHKGELETGTELLRQALVSLHSEEHEILHTIFSGALAQGLRLQQRLDEALAIVDGAIDRANGSGGAVELAELLRLKAEIVAARKQSDRGWALDLIDRSLDTGKEQGALAYQLRSAITLARFQGQHGCDRRAQNVLASIYTQFTEGFETPDLQTARAILASHNIS